MSHANKSIELKFLESLLTLSFVCEPARELVEALLLNSKLFQHVTFEVDGSSRFYSVYVVRLFSRFPSQHFNDHDVIRKILKVA